VRVNKIDEMTSSTHSSFCSRL